MSAPDGDPVRIPLSSEPYKASLVETAASTGGDACIKGNPSTQVSRLDALKMPLQKIQGDFNTLWYIRPRAGLLISTGLQILFLLTRRRESVERFGKDNCRIRYVLVRSGAAKYRANQLDIDPVLVSGTSAQPCLRQSHRAAQKHRRIDLTDWERNACGSRKPAPAIHTFLGKAESTRWALHDCAQFCAHHQTLPGATEC